jgi:hypothetical protein
LNNTTKKDGDDGDDEDDGEDGADEDFDGMLFDSAENMEMNFSTRVKNCRCGVPYRRRYSSSSSSHRSKELLTIPPVCCVVSLLSGFARVFLVFLYKELFIFFFAVNCRLKRLQLCWVESVFVSLYFSISNKNYDKSLAVLFKKKSGTGSGSGSTPRAGPSGKQIGTNGQKQVALTGELDEQPVKKNQVGVEGLGEEMSENQIYQLLRDMEGVGEDGDLSGQMLWQTMRAC